MTVLLLIGGCATANLAGYGGGGEGSGESDQHYLDYQLTAAVNRALVRSGEVDAMAIDVATRRGGVVELVGRVRDRRMADRAEQIASEVEGVVSVYNRLTTFH